MAEFVPENLRTSASAGEKRIFELLKKLDDDCLVYYEPLLNTGKPDFIVIIPDVGVLIIEVKGGYAGHIVEMKHDTIGWRREGGYQREEHPIEQARRYMHGLVNECKGHDWARPLLRSGGNHRGRHKFPIGLVAVFNNITREQLDRLGPEAVRIFPRENCITRDVLADLEKLDGPALKQAFKDCFNPWWPFGRLNNDDVKLLRALIRPEIVVKGGATDIAVLDLRQERQARAIGDGHRILSGVAGSGKTVILIARARYLAQDKNRSILVLCYNRPLSFYLKDALCDLASVEVRTFYSWAGKNVTLENWNDQETGEKLLSAMENGCADGGRYDAVLIDEGQDFLKSWFQAAKRALKDPDNGDLLIAGDGAQSFRPRDIKTWSEAGIHARGRVIGSKLHLDRNYRNTKEILAVAASFAGTPKPARGTQEPEPPFATGAVEPESAVRSGPWPESFKLDSRQQECQFVATKISGWLVGGITIAGQQHPVTPSDIAVIYPYNVDGLRDQLLATLRGVSHVVDLTPNSFSDNVFRRIGVRLCTAAKVKGLQFKIVVLVAADQLPADFSDTNEDGERAKFYVALTRAEDVLLVTHSGESTFTRTMNEALRAKRD
jgi:hypothetical protein